jgi:peptidoglycan hydrolase-like protein with peptidoglycan-binding domain
MYEGRRSPIRLIVIHTMEAAETTSTAESVGNYFAKPSTQASAHVGIDTDSECRYVADCNTAWAAPGANADGLQLELAGSAKQSVSDWADKNSCQILELAIVRVALWCKTYSIPPRLLTQAQLADGKSKGIVGHDLVSKVFRLSSHWDPGMQFPWPWFLMRVRSALYATPAPLIKPITAPPSTRIKLNVDGVFGPRTMSRLQQWAKAASINSAMTTEDWKCVQRMIGVKDDGVFGPVSWRKLQGRIGATVDGVPGPKTCKALQDYLNQTSLVGR